MMRPESALAAKLSRSKVSDSELEDRFAEAEARISDVAAGFVEWVAQDLAVARAEIDRLAMGEGSVASVKAIFRIAHDIKGQGGTFGYALATAIGAPLCDFLRTATQMPTEAQVGVIKAHLLALHVVFSNGIKGDGDESVRGLLDRLAQVRSRVPPLS
jgi:chemotaxis protein histidine kinase CheA